MKYHILSDKVPILLKKTAKSPNFGVFLSSLSKYVKIESESFLTAQVDGEILPQDKKFEVKILPKSLKVIYP